MADYISITSLSSGSSNTDIKAISSGDAIGGAFLREFDMTLVAGAVKFWADSQAWHLTDSERQFEEQKRLFELIPPLFLEPYRGLFVISHDGEILDTDQNLDALTSRFFAEHGDLPVFLGKVGGQLREVIDTHF
jgi:hypothetical protein